MSRFLPHAIQKMFAGQPRPKSHRCLAGRRLGLEGLERRAMFAIGNAATVNTTTALDQALPAVAAAADGRSVIVWATQVTSSDIDIYAQRYTATGSKAGGEIRVATGLHNEVYPDVAMANNGSFVVTWTDQISSSNYDIKAQRFSSAGAKVGSAIVVANTSKYEDNPSIASDANGNFVVAWTVQTSSSNTDVLARRFSSSGGAFGGAFAVATSSLAVETYPDVARSPDGRFAISYSTSAGNGDVILKRYSSGGTLAGTHGVATGSAQHRTPRISMNKDAHTIVAWSELVGSDYDIKARRVTNAGFMSSPITVSSTLSQEIGPDVSFKRDGNAFVVTHVNTSDGRTYVSELTTAGARRYQFGFTASVARAAVAFGSGSSYQIAYSQSLISSGLNVVRRRGTLS